MMKPESIYYLFDVGNKIKQEDYIWPIPGKATENDRVFIVCDGDGSFHNGGIASRLICQFMAADVMKFGEQGMSGELIDRLLVEARDRLIIYAREYRLDTELATTFSMLILYDEKVLMSWCGDSWMYHLRGGEILFSTENHSSVPEPIQNTAIASGIKADHSPINAKTKWIEDVKEGDYFMLCSKGLRENVTDNDIKSLVSQNDHENIDLTGSFRRLAFERTQDNYSMYLIKVNAGTQKRGIKSGINASMIQTSGNVIPIFILALTIIGLLSMVLYFRRARTSDSALKDINQTTQPVNDLRRDSVPGAIVKPAIQTQPANFLHDDSVASAFVISAPRKPIPAKADSVKNNNENPPAAPLNDHSAAIHAEEKPEQTNQTPTDQKKQVAQLLIKFTTDESCTLRITNLDLDEVVDWDLSQNDIDNIYLKPGKYSIVARSVRDSSKSKTYNFDVKPGDAHSSQDLHIRF